MSPMFRKIKATRDTWRMRLAACVPMAQHAGGARNCHSNPQLWIVAWLATVKECLDFMANGRCTYSQMLHVWDIYICSRHIYLHLGHLIRKRKCHTWRVLNLELINSWISNKNSMPPMCRSPVVLPRSCAPELVRWDGKSQVIGRLLQMRTWKLTHSQAVKIFNHDINTCLHKFIHTKNYIHLSMQVRVPALA